MDTDEVWDVIFNSKWYSSSWQLIYQLLDKFWNFKSWQDRASLGMESDGVLASRFAGMLGFIRYLGSNYILPRRHAEYN